MRYLEAMVQAYSGSRIALAEWFDGTSYTAEVYADESNVLRCDSGELLGALWVASTAEQQASTWVVVPA